MSGKKNESKRYPSGSVGPAIAAALLATSLSAASQDQAPKSKLEQQLQAAYVPTVMDGIKVTHTGTTLVVKKDGIQANPPNLGYYGNDYESGQVTAGSISSATDTLKSTVTDRIPWKRPKKKLDSRALAVDEKVYLLKIEVNPASIDLYVQSCGTCDPSAADPTHDPYRAKVSVHFVKRFLTASDFSQVQQTINEILAVPNASAEQSAQVQPQQDAPLTQAPPAPIPPPEAPPAEPVHIGVGQTTDQVVAALGKPDNIVTLDTKEIYVYKNLKVTFVKGQATNFE